MTRRAHLSLRRICVRARGAKKSARTPLRARLSPPHRTLYWRFRFFMFFATTRIIYSFGLAPLSLLPSTERRFFFVYSIFNPPKKEGKKTRKRESERKRRFGNNMEKEEKKRNGIEKFGKNCHLPRLSIITTTNMCIWIFFLYARWLFYAFSSSFELLFSCFSCFPRRKKKEPEAASVAPEEEEKRIYIEDLKADARAWV
jgi:hypothetical protein